LTALSLESTDGSRPAELAGTAAISASDEELMAAVAGRGAEAAYEALVRRHWAAAYRVALSCLGARQCAEDAVQECFLRLVRARRSYRRGAAFSPWFYTLLRNVCRDELRRRAHRPRTGAELPEPAWRPDPAGEAAGREAAGSALDLFVALPAADREILSLRIHAGLDFPAIARTAGLSTEATKKRAYRALERLRRGMTRRS
jgi:RNA polymerase sigma-70 factor (ECF subfamily)